MGEPEFRLANPPPITLLEIYIMLSVKVQQLPYIGPRKLRKQETNRFVVKWIDGSDMKFMAFKRDSAACAFLNTLVDAGYQARILMK
jgi:hypothetical protein